MSKHVIDRPRARAEGERVAPYLEIARTEGGPGKREQALHRGASGRRDGGQRLREFARIEREGAGE